MQALLVSTGVVAISEIGDKTQLLALLLASRFQQPVPIVLGILVATLLNHAVAALAGAWIATLLDPSIMRWVLGLLFLGMAEWALMPDSVEGASIERCATGGAFVATTVCFFLAEMGDKTQIATAGLAARFDMIVPIIIGTTLGMLVADIPAVLCGHLAGDRLDVRWAKYAAAAVFAVMGMLTLLGISLP